MSVWATGEQTSLADRKRRAGQRLFIGIAGLAVSEDERRLIAELQPAGFVLFARNVAEPGQVRDLNRELRSLVDPHTPAICAVDQEGGRVQRIKEPLSTSWPPMAAVGAEGSQVEQVSRAIARELRAMDFDLNFAPVADVHSNPDNPIIGDRAFGTDPDVVARHVAAFVKGHQDEGLIACAKHFPGHGDTATDSHLELPVVERPEPELRRTELPPFRAAVQAGVGTIMTSHVLYPTWDEAAPATLSERIAPALLRDELGYEGVLLSDDMEMKAVAGRWTWDQAVVRATRATVDALLVCKEPEVQLGLWEALVRAQEADEGMDRASQVAVQRIRALRERFLLGRAPAPTLEAVGHPEHRALAARVRDRSSWSA